MFLWVLLQHLVVGYITQSELAELDPDFTENFIAESNHFCDQDAVFRMYRTLPRVTNIYWQSLAVILFSFRNYRTVYCGWVPLCRSVRNDFHEKKQDLQLIEDRKYF